MVSLWERLGVPLKVSKLEGPTHSLKCLGIDSFSATQSRLPDEKLQCPNAKLASCIQRNIL